MTPSQSLFWIFKVLASQLLWLLPMLDVEVFGWKYGLWGSQMSFSHTSLDSSFPFSWKDMSIPIS